MHEQFTLPARAQVTKPAGGEFFLFAESLSGRIEVEYRLRASSGQIITSSHVLGEQDQVEFIAPLVEMTVRNLTNAPNDIVLRGGFAKYHPRTDAGQVEVVGTVDVTGSGVSVTGVVDVDTDAATAARIIAAASTNETSVKAAAGTVFSVSGTNVSAAAQYLKIYDLAVAPNLATDVPAMTLALPVGPFNFEFAGMRGVAFATGIAYAITGAVGDNDTTPTAAGDVVATLTYL